MKTTDEAIQEIISQKYWRIKAGRTSQSASNFIRGFRNGTLGVKAKESVLKAFGYVKIDAWLEPNAVTDMPVDTSALKPRKKIAPIRYDVVTKDGDKIDAGITLYEARKRVAVYVEQDIKDGNYEADAYQIVRTTRKVANV